MQYLLILIATLVAIFAPRRDHALFVSTVAAVVESEAPLFKDDEDKSKTAALLAAIAFRESSFDITAKSKTNDSCWFQIHDRDDLAEKPEECTRVAMTMIRESMRMCPEHPLAFYASGPIGCTDARAQRISADRMQLARWALAKSRE